MLATWLSCYLLNTKSPLTMRYESNCAKELLTIIAKVCDWNLKGSRDGALLVRMWHIYGFSLLLFFLYSLGEDFLFVLGFALTFDLTKYGLFSSIRSRRRFKITWGQTNAAVPPKSPPRFNQKQRYWLVIVGSPWTLSATSLWFFSSRCSSIHHSVTREGYTLQGLSERENGHGNRKANPKDTNARYDPSRSSLHGATFLYFCFLFNWLSRVGSVVFSEGGRSCRSRSQFRARSTLIMYFYPGWYPKVYLRAKKALRK